MIKHTNQPVALPTIEQIEAERKRIRHKTAYHKSLLQTFYVLILVAAIAVLISSFFLPVVKIIGNSMNPVLEKGDIVLILKRNYFKSGDIISFPWNNKTLIKRIIAGPGDWVEIDDTGTVYVNQKALEEPYIIEKSLGQCDLEFPVQIGDDEYFVIGDQRESSIDSRNSVIGNVKKEHLIGRVTFRIWPLQKIGFIN